VGRKTTLYSRRQNVLNRRFPYITKALDHLPDGTVVDGELVAMGPDGHPDFNLLQNFRSAEPHITYYAFDILVHKNRDLTQLPLSERRALLRSVLKPNDHVDLSEVSDRSAAEMLSFVKKQGLEGVVAKRSDSIYQPSLRTGLWSKHRINLGQEFVIGGYIPSNLGVDSLVIGFYRGKDLIFAARVVRRDSARRKARRQNHNFFLTVAQIISTMHQGRGRRTPSITVLRLPAPLACKRLVSLSGQPVNDSPRRVGAQRRESAASGERGAGKAAAALTP
jgi:bifunctional non-homologous end joining protein LigD